jgi:hypothetical protein
MGRFELPYLKRHYHLKVACLPISPHRQKRLAKLPNIYLLANNSKIQIIQLMALELSAKLIKKLPEVTGTGKNGSNWIKQEFVLETQDQYPKKVCMSVWGDKTQDLAPLQEGEIVKVQFNVESREYNDRWYTEIRAYRLDRMGSSPSVPPNVEASPAGGYQFPPLAAESGDDLPF